MAFPQLRAGYGYGEVLEVPIMFCLRAYASCVHTSTHSEGVSVEGVSLDMTLGGLRRQCG